LALVSTLETQEDSVALALQSAAHALLRKIVRRGGVDVVQAVVQALADDPVDYALLDPVIAQVLRPQAQDAGLKVDLSEPPRRDRAGRRGSLDGQPRGGHHFGEVTPGVLCHAAYSSRVRPLRLWVVGL